MRLSGEQLYDVIPLSTTGDSVPDAAQLFVDRARLVAPTLKPSAAQWRSIIEITSWLDGMPLAIEMAASRARHTGLAELAEAVRHDLSLLAIDAVDAPTRQRTMQAWIDWSFRQLDPSLQQVLMPLSVFEGLFDLPDACAVSPRNCRHRR